MNSMRTTYLPRAIPDRANLPSEFVAATYFFPVSVLAAVTVTPGSGVFPLFADPVISNVVATGAVAAAVWGAGAAGAVSCDGGGEGGASCARKAGGDKSATHPKTKTLLLMDFNSASP
jgi:hypothetical protein